MYVTDATPTRPSHAFEHLSCFLPGLFILGVHTLRDELPPKDRQLHLWAAEGLAQTCWLTYADQTSGLGPDVVAFQAYFNGANGLWVNQLKKWEDEGSEGDPPGVAEREPVKDVKGRDYSNRSKGYFLRPEALETFYLMWKATGDEKWRERSWYVTPPTLFLFALITRCEILWSDWWFFAGKYSSR